MLTARGGMGFGFGWKGDAGDGTLDQGLPRRSVSGSGSFQLLKKRADQQLTASRRWRQRGRRPHPCESSRRDEGCYRETLLPALLCGAGDSAPGSGWEPWGTPRNWLLFGKGDPSPGWPRNVPLLSGGLRPTERPGSCWKPHAQE